MVKKKTWEEFRACGLLWWINRILHTFGWALIVEVDTNNKFIGVYPARVTYRGFESDAEERGFKRISSYMEKIGAVLKKETEG